MTRIDAPTLGSILAPEHNNFAAARLTLALAVVVSHSFYLATGVPLTSEPVYAWTGYSLGQHAVQLFFLLSGILVSQSLVRGGVISYAKARALRIFPGLIVCVLLTALVVGPLVSSHPTAAYFTDGELFRYLRDTLTLKTGMAPLPGVFDGNPAAGVVNSSLWTLKYEVVCYILLAAIGGLAIRFRIAGPVGMAALAGFMVLAVFNPPALAEGNGLFDQVQYFALFFGTGVLAYALRDSIRLHWAGVPAALALIAVTNGTNAAEFGHAVGLGYMMLWLSALPAGGLRAFTNRNDYSYGVYIYGVPVGQVILLLSPGLGGVTLALATAVLAILLAALSWALVEKPALALRHGGKTANRKSQKALPRLPRLGASRATATPPHGDAAPVRVRLAAITEARREAAIEHRRQPRTTRRTALQSINPALN